jgi:hypothetical protein
VGFYLFPLVVADISVIYLASCLGWMGCGSVASSDFLRMSCSVARLNNPKSPNVGCNCLSSLFTFLLYPVCLAVLVPAP